MGREVRRVPLDFDWPLDKTWPGFTYTPDPDSLTNCGCPEEWSVETLCAFHRAQWDTHAIVELPPPTGDGWQLWQTVSEGSPISPVFGSTEELARWMATPTYTSALQSLSYDEALAFVRQGSAPSMVFTPRTGLVSGEKFAAFAAEDTAGTP